MRERERERERAVVDVVTVRFYWTVSMSKL